MSKVALASYIPPGPPGWPDAGIVERNQLMVSDEIKVLALPCQHSKHLHWQAHAHWVVLQIEPADYEEEGGFVRFRKGQVLFNGSPREAHAFLKRHDLPAPCSLEPLQVGHDWENVSLGEYGIAIAGQDADANVSEYGMAYTTTGQATAGNHSAAVSRFGDVKAGDFGCAWTSDGEVAVAGHRGVAWTYEGGRSEVRGVGVAITDDWGNAVAGDFGIAIAGCEGVAVTGKCGVAFARDAGRVTAGEAGVLLLRWRDEIRMARVGEGGIKPNTFYCLNEDGNFVESPANANDHHDPAQTNPG